MTITSGRCVVGDAKTVRVSTPSFLPSFLDFYKALLLPPLVLNYSPFSMKGKRGKRGPAGKGTTGTTAVQSFLLVGKRVSLKIFPAAAAAVANGAGHRCRHGPARQVRLVARRKLLHASPVLNPPDVRVEQCFHGRASEGFHVDRPVDEREP